MILERRKFRLFKSGKLTLRDDQNNLIGLARIEDLNFTAAYLANLDVAEECRNAGVGGMMMRRIIEIAKENNCTAMSLKVMKKNAGAIRFYERFGFFIVCKNRVTYLMALDLSTNKKRC